MTKGRRNSSGGEREELLVTERRSVSWGKAEGGREAV